MSDAAWRPLAGIVAAYADAGRPPRFWLRDDDAVAPGAALDRLLDMTGRAGVPVALAVIPAFAQDALAIRLAGTDHATVLVHGWSHADHAGAHGKSAEIGPHRPLAAMLAELRTARTSVEGRFGAGALPVLVPPWNRIDPALMPHLGALGYRAVSAFGPPKPSPLPMVNATVDPIDWHGGRGCRPVDELVAGIVDQLRRGLADPRLPAVGILTHHLVHDAAAWDFLKGLFAATAGEGCDWLSISDLVLR